MIWIVAAVVIVIAGVGWWLRRRPDIATIGRSFAAYLAANHPQLPSAKINGEWLDIPGPGGDMRINLHNLSTKVRAARGVTGELFRAYARTIVESLAAAGPLQIEKVRARIFPRLIERGYLHGMQRTASQERVLAVRSVTGLPTLRVAYVINAQSSVRYLFEDDLKDLELDATQLEALAMGNLRDHWDAQVIRQAIADKKGVVVQSGDSFDATRLLLIPEALNEGESLVAIIPDRDSLFLAPLPAEGDWSALEKVAAMPVQEHALLNRPILVTRDGFSLK